MSPLQNPRALRLSALLLAFAGIVLSAHAHFCGPPQIHLRVGETCPWQIIADMIEVNSTYTPALTGPVGIVSVTPLKVFQTRHGDFTITGLAPGTNVLVVNWFYPGPPPAGRVCAVEIIVTADDGGPRPDRPQSEGALCTPEFQVYIYGRYLRQMLDHYLPAVTPKLMIMTQCYAGDIVTSGHFKDAPNIAIGTGTSPNQEGKYGGYDDDAARGLKPGEGRTARDVHEAGSAGKWIVEPADATTDKRELHFLGEWPRTGGGLALENFSMAPVTASGPVRSRHVVVFSGKPSIRTNKMEIGPDGTTVNAQAGKDVVASDAMDRDTVKSNFAGQPNTTVRTVGGEEDEANPTQGKNGWDFPGSRDGLRRAIEEAGNAIRNSPNPELEQFILFVGDHGMPGRGDTSKKRTNANARSETPVAENFTPLAADDPLIDGLLREPDNQPGFHLFLEPDESRRLPRPRPAAPATGLDSAKLRLLVKVGGASILEIPNPAVAGDDVDNDGTVDPARSEGWTVFFPVEEWFAIHHLAGTPVTLVLDNDSDLDLVASEAAFLGGAIARGSGVIPTPLFLTTTRLANADLEFKLRVLPGRHYDLEFSGDLVQWTTVKPVLSNETTILVRATPPPGNENGFYRLRFTE